MNAYWLIILFLITLINVSPLATQNFYEVLGVSLGSSQTEIKKAYRKLAMELHPDKINASLSDNEKEQTKERFIACQAAYETLFDPFKRSQYNAILEGVTDDNTSVEPERYMKGSFKTTIKTQKIHLVFETTFPDDNKVTEIPLKVNVPLSTVFTGGPQHNQTYYYRKTCPICNGNGGFEGMCSTCGMCKGKRTALHKYTHHGGHFHQETTTQCGACNGRGYTAPKKCSHCGGSGLALTEGWLMVDIPRGFANRQQFVFPGMGHARPHHICHNASTLTDSAHHDTAQSHSETEDTGTAPPLPDGDVVVELLYDMPDSYSLVEDSPFDLQYNVSVPIDSLVRDDYVLELETPNGELAKVAIPVNTSFSDLLAGHTHRLPGLGLFTSIVPQHEDSKEVCEEVCEIIGDNQSCTSTVHCETHSVPPPPLPPRGDLIVNMEASFDTLADSSPEDMQEMLRAIFSGSGVSASDPLFGRFYSILVDDLLHNARTNKTAEQERNSSEN